MVSENHNNNQSIGDTQDLPASVDPAAEVPTAAAPDQAPAGPDQAPAGPDQAPASDAHCPNCNGPGIKKGQQIVCEQCDATFKFTKKGPMVAELGPFDKLEERVSNLENRTDSGIIPEEDEEPEPPRSAQDEIDDDEDGI